MCEHKRALRVCIISNDIATGLCLIGIGLQMVSHHQLNHLRSLAPGCRTHVKHRVVRLHVQKQGRQHAHDFLASDQAGVSKLDHQLVDLLQARVLLEQVPGYHHFEKRLVRVESLTVDAQRRVVNFRCLKAEMLIWCLLDGLVGELRNKIGVTEHLRHLLVVVFTSVDPESDW